ncbi:tetratricopeptide TPR_2 repeat-containing protein [Nostoc linckia z18]|uniref:Tetratricopeptide TPR_2 repeat-containing protein n=2 Tax=Nostoc linckia TaxID=92942 RepID=A0A9Q6EHN6_NOSLI|nr:tetratricopeptide repeat protein [Nostoc linckia]PHK27686.1 tetratricopeptide TPR_2 repeat-containing protein [Nostoc linckia z15]PHK38378.1 tetratricopeptide TPR_2 repeat-containing protein [Nostoc linckia z16]PHJ56154.1 tetratricopeptide TPR_2 repeat-containing protein [Nostoc linckia z3]PHJ68761.1 tetratricopeptide TPR_2 repeat-containing protein [Nostoc linckia z1]PHJ74071.1 tetratricopeptide TPR_2 repeat-containing protein [Nostoc linckia z2]
MSKNLATLLAQFSQSSVVEMNACLLLDEKPIKQAQKLKTLSKYMQQYPQGWKKRLELAKLFYAMGRWEQAIEEYQQVIERQPQLLDARLQLAKILHLIGRQTEAIEVYENMLPLSHHEANRQHISGLIEACKGNNQKAIKALESAAFLEPDKVVHWLALGQVHMAMENTVAALQAFDAVLSIDPDDIIALILSYDALIALGNVQAAGQKLSKVIELAPDDFQVLQRQLEERCRMRLVLGEQGKQTKNMIGSALQQAPNAPEFHKLLAYYHIFRGDWVQGVAVLAQFTEKHPNNPTGWYYYGRCLADTGENKPAAEAILKAYHLYPNDCEIYRGLCDILPAAGKLNELYPLAEEMLRRFPERWSAWATAGRVLVESFKEIEWGCSVCARATQLQPQLPDAWFCYGRVLALAGKHQEAVEALVQGWQFLPEKGAYLQSLPGLVWLGESYRVLGNNAVSRRYWQETCLQAQKIMEFDPATAFYWQARALEQLKDELGAIEAYRNALSQQLLYPAHGEVKNALKWLQSMLRNGSRA